MITTYFEAPHTLRRLRAPKACAHIDSFAASLGDAGYTRWTIRGYLRAAAHFGRWADRARVAVSAFGDRSLARFRTEHLPVCRCIKRNRGQFGDAEAGARLFVSHLRERGIVPRALIPTADPFPPLLMSFGTWMAAHRGTASSTVGLYQRALVGVLARLGDDPRSYTAASLRAFVVEHARRRGGAASKTVVSALRAFVRYLIADGRCPVGLHGAVPTVARWRLDSLPRYIDLKTMERVVAAGRDDSARGLRDHAVLLLLARLGLRGGDVAALRFDDVDWEKASIRVRGKGRRETRLPLPQDVGDALAAYIERGRAVHPDTRIFLRVRAPHRPLASYAAISDIVRRALRHADVDAPCKGAHLLRHSFATAMLRAGGTLETVGAVLRHQSPQTTLIYAKVDVASLSTIAQPWPETTSC